MFILLKDKPFTNPVPMALTNDSFKAKVFDKNSIFFLENLNVENSFLFNIFFLNIFLYGFCYMIYIYYI